MNFKTTQLKPFATLVEPVAGIENMLDLDLSQLRMLFEQEHLLVLRGFQPFSSAEAFSDYCGQWGEVCVWPFGKVLELKEQEKPEDHIFDNSYVPLHWDGMYRKQVPEIQIFQCVSSPGVEYGGRTTFSHTPMAYRRVSEKVRSSWKQVTGVYQRKMEFYDSKTAAPIVDAHPVRGFPVIRFCEPPVANDKSFVNHPSFHFEGVSDQECSDFLLGLREALYSPENFYAHTWEAGDIVISDNYTLLHGRESFTHGAPRHLRRVQVHGNPALNNPHLLYTR